MDIGRRNTPLRVGLVQIKPAKGHAEGNVATVRARIADACGEADLLLFPETCLTGYFLEGGVFESAITATELVERLGPPPPAAPDVVVGFYERARRRFHNSAAYLEPDGSTWRIRHVHRKIFLPTYGVFDEARFVEPGLHVEAFDTRLGRFGLLVCEDAWHSLPGTILALAGAELVLVPSASPARGFAPSPTGRPANLARWDRIAPAMAAEHGIFVAVTQLVGSEGGKLFPGGSVVVGPDGETLARGPLFEEETTLARVDGAAIERTRAHAPLLSHLERALPWLSESLERAGAWAADGVAVPGEEAAGPPPAGAPRVLLRGGTSPGGSGRAALEDLSLDLALTERALVEFIREEVRRRRGFERVVLGVSGGVDSAVSLFLACRALGPENVFGFLMPYRTSSESSLEHAELALAAVGAEARRIDITGPIDRYVECHEPDLTPLRRGNLMARLRGVILFDQAAKLRALPLGTGNKSERLLGYFTWHADDAPPINPLGDLLKTQVWALARHLGVPAPIVEKPASADLIQDVHDEDELGVSYQVADPILEGLLAGYRAEELVALGFDGRAVELVSARLGSSHWKRELPTVAVLSGTAIGEYYLRPVDY